MILLTKKIIAFLGLMMVIISFPITNVQAGIAKTLLCMSQQEYLDEFKNSKDVQLLLSGTSFTGETDNFSVFEIYGVIDNERILMIEILPKPVKEASGNFACVLGVIIDHIVLNPKSQFLEKLKKGI